MGQQVGFKEIIIAGGPVLAGMILLSIYCIALIWERWKFFGKATGGYRDLLARVRAAAAAGKLQDAAALAKTHKGLAAAVVTATLTGPTNRDPPITRTFSFIRQPYTGMTSAVQKK